MTNNVTELLQKLHELSVRGVDGEKDNAAKMLDRVLKKHGLILADIPSLSRTETVEFPAVLNDPTNQYQFNLLIVKNVIGHFSDDDSRGSFVESTGPWKNRKHTFIVRVTPAEKVEIVAKLDFYWNQYLKEIKTFQSAFFTANKLFTKDAFYTVDELTPEQLDEKKRIDRMSRGIEEKNYFDRLDNPNK